MYRDIDWLINMALVNVAKVVKVLFFTLITIVNVKNCLNARVL